MALSETVLSEIETFGLYISRLRNKEIPEERFKRFRLQNGVYGQRQPGVQMVRVKIPGGVLTATKLRCLADVAEMYSTGKGHVTTRQDMQFHFVSLDDIQAMLRHLAGAGLTTREACGNTVRNVTACHVAGICPTEIFDVTPFSRAVAEHLLRNPVNQDLPRKFKISFSGCASECGMAAIHDIGFIAAIRHANGASEYGFKVLVGGGLGSHPKLAQLYAEFLPFDDVLPTCEAILKIFDAHGDRKIRSKARMKFIVEKWGIERFKEEVLRACALLKASDKVYPPLPPVRTNTVGRTFLKMADHSAQRSGYARWSRENIISELDDGTCAVHVRLVLGDITAGQLRQFADIMDRFEIAEVRATHQQNFLLRGVRKAVLADLYNALEQADLGRAGAEGVPDVIACPGADSCQLALTSSMGLGRAITHVFDQSLPDYDDLNGLRIRISGCPNSCGHHHIAGIGFHGVGKKVHGKLAPHYQLHLGGGVTGEHASIGRSKLKIPAKNVPAAVMELIKLFRTHRRENEAFNPFVERYGRDAMTDALAPLAALETPQDAPEAYHDWDDDKDFTLDDLGPGECAGTMIDLIENHLHNADSSLERATMAARQEAYGDAIEAMQEAILRCCRALLIPFGIDSPNDLDILKLFQHSVVEQGLVTERFEFFTKDLGQWIDFDLSPVSVSSQLDTASAFVTECKEAYDRLDANLKLRKQEALPEGAAKGSAPPSADSYLDLSGVACPMNFVKTKLRLEDMEPGQLLEVVIDDGEPMRNVPRSVQAEGHKVNVLEALPDGHYRMVIEKA